MQDDVVITNQPVDVAVVADSTAELAPPIVIPHASLEPIREHWIGPLIERIAALERDAGRLEAERDHARQVAATVAAERDAVVAAQTAVVQELEAVTLERNSLLVTRDRLRDRVKELEYKVRSAQDTTALRAIQGYDLPHHRPVRHRRLAFWKRS